MPNEPKEGNLTEQEGADATANLSENGDQPSEANLSALTKRIEQLERENRALQSGKDKRWNEVMPIVTKVADMLGIDEKKVLDAQRNLVLDELVASKFQPAPKPDVQGSTETKGSAVEVSAVVTALGLNAADTDVAAIIASPNGITSQIAELSKLAVSRVSKPQPTDAQESSLTGGNSPSKLSAEQIAQKEARLAELYRFPSAHRDEIKQLEKELGW